MEIRTTGDLRGFLGETLLGIRDGTIDKGKADSIAKVASQINQSLSVEVNAAIQLKKLGEGDTVAGSMLLTSNIEFPAQKKALPTRESDPVGFKARTDLIWCAQCDQRQSPDFVRLCDSKLCKAKAALA